MIDFVSPKKNFFSSDHKDYFDKLFHSIILFNIFPVVSGTIRLENALVKEQYDKICDEISKLDKTERKKYKKEKENIIEDSIFKNCEDLLFDKNNYHNFDTCLHFSRNLLEDFMNIYFSDGRIEKFNPNVPYMLLVEPNFSVDIRQY